MSQYFPKPFNLSNYATKTDIKNISHVDTSSFVLKTNLANLKTEIDELDIEKLIPIPADLSKSSNVGKNDVVKKSVYNKLVAKVDNIDTSDFVLRTKYNTDKTGLENKIPDTSGLVKKTNYNTKITELENKIPDISNLATKTALTAIENKIPSVSDLVKKIYYNTEVAEIENKLHNHNHDKYIDTSEFTLATNFFNARLAQANLITKTDLDAKLSNLNRKITQNKSKHLLVEKELNTLKTFDSSYFIGKSHFGEDGTQNYLVFQPMNKYLEVDNSDYVLSWTCKGLSNENIITPSTRNNFLSH